MNPIPRRGLLAYAAAAASVPFAHAAAPDTPAGPVLDLRALGAGAGDDDTPAFREGVRRLVEAGGGLLRVPVGTYRLAGPVAADLPRGVSLAVRGDGPGLSRLIWAGGDGLEIGFTPDGGFDGPKAAVEVAGISLLAAGSGGTALRLVSRGGSSPAPRKTVRDLVLAGASPEAGWAVGLDAADCTFLSADGLDFQGASRSEGTAVRFSGADDPVDNYVSRLRVFGARTGVEVTGTCEGLYVTQSTLLFVERGVHWHTDGGEPLLAISGCHVSASRDCLLGHNLMQPIVTGNLFYQSGDEDWAGVRLTADGPTPHDLPQVSGNTIHGFPTGSGKRRTGIAVSRRSGGLISGNLIHRVDVGVHLAAGSSRVRAVDNVVSESAAAVLDEGEENMVREI